MANDVGERIVAIETTLHGDGGVLARLKELGISVEELKKTIWKATGAAVTFYLVVEFLTKVH